MSDECSEATLRINGLARQMRRWKMSDLRQFVATPTVEELEAEIEQLRAGCDRLHGYIAEKDAEVERLKAALAESCDENRTVVLEEGPFSTDMCPLAGRQQAEIERVETFNRANWAALQEAQRQIERLKAALRKICSTEKRLTNHGYEIARQALEDDE